MSDSNSRAYIRHPSDIPLHWRVSSDAPAQVRMKDISEGGLAFHADEAIAVGASIEIGIPIEEPAVTICGDVVWCQCGGGGGYEVGVRFCDGDERFRMRMVEQVCHIEHFRRETRARTGRDLSAEDAAIEWIGLYARDFAR